MFDIGIQTTQHFTVSPAEIPVDHTVVERGLGYKRGRTPEIVSHLLEETLPHVPEYAEIQCGFTILPPEMIRIHGDSFACDGVTFATGQIIAKRLRKSHTFAFFVATIGPRPEQWARELMEGPESVKGYMVDAIASCLVEGTANWLEARLEEIVQPLGWKVTNRYSPGHCGWSVAQQHELFSFLPEHFCGIHLTPTALMVPIKSVSGVIGLGESVKREEYQCSLCDVEDCYRREEIPANT